mmetsp:Transcript_23069/g.32948  ORF Transcript_23069/g.32948 Transcript_23069/m.32948 type:complete len:189 (-) Transcript_23069:566-1132(-)
MSYPLVHMSRSNVKHRLGNCNFIVMLKHKLVLPIYHPASAPVCKCGTTHDIYGHHHFRCTRISKKAAHNYINENGLQPALQQVLPTAGIISPSSIVQTEASQHIAQQPLLRPFAIEYQPNHTLGTPTSHRLNSPFVVLTSQLTIALILLLTLPLKTFPHLQPMLNDVYKPQRRGSSRQWEVVLSPPTQ